MVGIQCTPRPLSAAGRGKSARASGLGWAGLAGEAAGGSAATSGAAAPARSLPGARLSGSGCELVAAAVACPAAESGPGGEMGDAFVVELAVGVQRREVAGDVDLGNRLAAENELAGEVAPAGNVVGRAVRARLRIAACKRSAKAGC